MTADIKPVAWFATYKSGELIRNYGDGSAVYACETEEDAKRVTRIHLGASGDVVALYPQSAIDSLRVMLDDAHADFGEMERLARKHKARAKRAEAEVAKLREALEDMLSGWMYIRATYGNLHGVGWDRAEQIARAALGGEDD